MAAAKWCTQHQLEKQPGSDKKGYRLELGLYCRMGELVIEAAQ